MKTVFKYTLAITDHQEITLPKGAQPLSVGIQNGHLMLWCLVDDQADLAMPRDVYVHGTGHKVDDIPLQYLGTVMLNGGALVFHVFIDPVEQ